MEMMFFPAAYRIVTDWKKHNVGQEYLAYIEGGK